MIRCTDTGAYGQFRDAHGLVVSKAIPVKVGLPTKSQRLDTARLLRDFHIFGPRGARQSTRSSR